LCVVIDSYIEILDQGQFLGGPRPPPARTLSQSPNRKLSNPLSKCRPRFTCAYRNVTPLIPPSLLALTEHDESRFPWSFPPAHATACKLHTFVIFFLSESQFLPPGPAPLSFRPPSRLEGLSVSRATQFLSRSLF